MSVFSFHPVKTITTGEGGAVVTSDGELHVGCGLCATMALSGTHRASSAATHARMAA